VQYMQYMHQNPDFMFPHFTFSIILHTFVQSQPNVRMNGISQILSNPLKTEEGKEDHSIIVFCFCILYCIIIIHN